MAQPGPAPQPDGEAPTMAGAAGAACRAARRGGARAAGGARGPGAPWGAAGARGGGGGGRGAGRPRGRRAAGRARHVGRAAGRLRTSGPCQCPPRARGPPPGGRDRVALTGGRACSPMVGARAWLGRVGVYRTLTPQGRALGRRSVFDLRHAGERRLLRAFILCRARRPPACTQALSVVVGALGSKDNGV